MNVVTRLVGQVVATDSPTQSLNVIAKRLIDRRRFKITPPVMSTHTNVLL